MYPFITRIKWNKYPKKIIFIFWEIEFKNCKKLKNCLWFPKYQKLENIDIIKKVFELRISSIKKISYQFSRE